MLASSQPLILEILKNAFDPAYKKKPTVVVVGNGLASSSFTKNIDSNKYNVKVISSSLKNINKPYIISDIDPSFTEAPSKMEIIEDEAIAVKERDNVLKCKNNSYNYDYLVIAATSEPDKEFLTTDKNHVTIIGADVNGVELAFKLASQGKSVDIMESSSEFLPGFSIAMRKKISSLLENANIKIALNAKVANKPNPKFIVNYMDPLKPNLYLMVKPRIFAIGDCITGHGPKTEKNARLQGSYLANMFNSNFKVKAEYSYTPNTVDTSDSLIIEYSEKLYVLNPLLKTIYLYLTR